MHFTIADKLPVFIGLDIALITLSNSFILNEYVKPICLPHNTRLTKININAIDEKWDGEQLTITGFGPSDDSNVLPDKLLYANVIKRNSEDCQLCWAKIPKLPFDWLQLRTENFCFKGTNAEVGKLNLIVIIFKLLINATSISAILGMTHFG